MEILGLVIAVFGCLYVGAIEFKANNSGDYND